jgi:putative flippase GtrA
MTRLPAFFAVGALGFGLQIGALAALTLWWDWPYVAATAAAVELAVLHNFAWHQRWTWRDRTGSAAAGSVTGRLAKYHLTTGITSIAGSVLLTAALVELLAIHQIAANVSAVALMSAANFVVSDRWVFLKDPMVKATLTLPLLAALLGSAPAEAAELQPATLAAWEKEAAAARSRLETSTSAGTHGREPQGGAIGVPDGAVHVWRGGATIRNVTLDSFLHGLQHPGTPPPQEDVLESRLLGRDGNTLRVYLKLVRRTIMTVTYDTEHTMTFTRRSPTYATSESVATHIRETDGGDRGFLWRLNSYWRYEQVGSDVRVHLESLSLSREVPFVLRPIAGPIIGRIARESVSRTLAALQQHFERRQAESALTSRPAAASAAWSLAASVTAPGVSPWTQSVRKRPSRAIRTPPATTWSGSVITAPGSLRGTSDPSGA